MSPSRRGLFLTFEGVEGSGKTTQIALLATALRDASVETVVTREPGGTPLGRSLRSLLLSVDAPAIAPDAEVLLYAADRTQHLLEVVLPALKRGAVVLCDRYLDATLAYQGFGRGFDARGILALHRRPPLDLRPARTILLDHDPKQSLDRALRRDRARVGSKEGKMEAESTAFHRRVRRGYLTLARREPARFRVVPAEGSMEEVERRVAQALADLLPLLARPKRAAKSRPRPK